MSTKNLIAGLLLLQDYRDDKDGSDAGGEHDVIYAYPTSNPLSNKDVQTMIDLDWHQEDVDDGDDDFSVSHYDHEESWIFYT